MVHGRISHINTPKFTIHLNLVKKNLIDQIYLVCPKGYEVDHMVPLSKGGDHHESNLCYLPGKVNNSKNDRSTEEFGIDIFNKNVIYWQDLLQV